MLKAFEFAVNRWGWAVDRGRRRAEPRKAGQPANSLRIRGICSAFRRSVQLFGDPPGWLQAPLSALQVADLFRAGCLRAEDTGSSSGLNTEDQSIDALLPLLKYRSCRQFTRRLPVARRRNPFRLSLPTAIPLVFLGSLATVVVGCFFFSAPPSMASPASTNGVSHADRTQTRSTPATFSPALQHPRRSPAPHVLFRGSPLLESRPKPGA
jgi:hypothetical protein